MNKLTVVTWLWQGWRPLYDVSHVEAMQRMLREFLPIPHEFMCVTDSPGEINFCRAIQTFDCPRVAVRESQPNCYRRLVLFGPRAREVFGDHILSIDLDCVIFQDISPLITDDDFKIVKGTQAPYNGSMWLLKTGTRDKVWSDFDPARSPITARSRMANGRNYLGSDQAWLSHRIPHEPMWSEDDGIYQFFKQRTQKEVVPANARMMFFPGLIKPWHPEVAVNYPSIYAQYKKFHY